MSSGGSIRAVRMEFVTRLYFLNLCFPEKPGHVFGQQWAEAETHIVRLKRCVMNCPPNKIATT